MEQDTTAYIPQQLIITQKKDSAPITSDRRDLQNFPPRQHALPRKTTSQKSNLASKNRQPVRQDAPHETAPHRVLQVVKDHVVVETQPDVANRGVLQNPQIDQSAEEPQTPRFPSSINTDDFSFAPQQHQFMRPAQSKIPQAPIPSARPLQPHRIRDLPPNAAQKRLFGDFNPNQPIQSIEKPFPTPASSESAPPPDIPAQPEQQSTSPPRQQTEISLIPVSETSTIKTSIIQQSREASSADLI